MMKRAFAAAATTSALAFSPFAAWAQTDEPSPVPPADAPASAPAAKELSPWLFAPSFSSNPKLGTTLGAMAGYIHRFDRASRPSVFAASGQYSNTGSLVAGAFAKTSFDADHQRLNAALAFGNIKNDYDDYLGTGVRCTATPSALSLPRL